jgi:hypothetical protein
MVGGKEREKKRKKEAIPGKRRREGRREEAEK